MQTDTWAQRVREAPLATSWALCLSSASTVAKSCATVGCSAGFSRSSNVSRPSAASDAAIMCGVFAASPPATITRTARTASAFACSPDARRSAAAVRPRRNSKAAARVLTLTCSHVATRV